MAALGDDLVFVPIGGFDRGLDGIALADFAGHFDFAIVLDEDLLPALGEDAAAFFLIEDAAVGFAALEVGLIAGDDGILGLDDFAAILDAGVAEARALAIGIGDLEFAGEFEIGDFTVLPDEEGVFLDGLVLGGVAGEGAVFDAPEFGLAFPAAEVFAVEEGFLAALREAGGEDEGEERWELFQGMG